MVCLFSGTEKDPEFSSDGLPPDDLYIFGQGYFNYDDQPTLEPALPKTLKKTTTTEKTTKKQATTTKATKKTSTTEEDVGNLKDGPGNLKNDDKKVSSAAQSELYVRLCMYRILPFCAKLPPL